MAASGGGGKATSERTALLNSGTYSRVSVAFSPETINSTYNDKPKDMTFSRRVARFLSKYSWYYPTKKEVSSSASNDDDDDDVEKKLATRTSGWVPDLDAIWAYFEHNQLPRHHIGCGHAKHNVEKAEAGESKKPTSLYSVWSTKEEDLADFGIGVGLYFLKLRSLSIILFIIAFINIPNIRYYYSKNYNNSNEQIRPILQSSAICTDERWVACPSCTRDDWDYFPATFDRYGEVNVTSTSSADTGDDSGTQKQLLTFIKLNDCRFGYVLGLFTLISLIFSALAIYVVSFYIIQRKERIYDEQQQTTTDYSISVENPPTDARDPNEWHNFFSSKFGNVSCVTVVVDNEELVRELCKRRQLLHQLEGLLPHDKSFDKHNLDQAVNDALPLTTIDKLMMSSDASTIKANIDKSTNKINELADNADQMKVSEVFVIFETEASQRDCLKRMDVRGCDRICDNKNALKDESLLFRGIEMLDVVEPDEPSAVRWQDLDETSELKFSQRLLTYLFTFGCIVGALFLITWARYRHGPIIAAFVIMCLNSVAPTLCTTLTDMESHSSETSKQASKYIKVTAFLWFNTTLATAFITPFPDTVSNDEGSIVHSLYAIFFAELIRAPITQILDPSGLVYRHIIAPRTKKVTKLLKLFQATPYQISDRYTDMTNTLFLTFYYGTIFPVGYFFAAATMMVHYWTDKFCLLRVWGPGPVIGSQVSKFCRNFILFTVLVYAIMSSYNIAGFPFDNACLDDDTVTSEYVGQFKAFDGDGEPIVVQIENNDPTYKFCNQDMMRYRRFTFPAIPSNQPEGGEWMDKDQERITRVYGYTSVLAVLVAIIIICRRVILGGLYRLCCKSYKPQGKEGGKTFSEVEEIFAYVPQVKVAGSPWPLLVCDTSQIDPELIGWTDPYVGHDPHNILLDIPGLVDKPAFSIVKDYLSPWARDRGLDK